MRVGEVTMAWLWGLVLLSSLFSLASLNFRARPGKK